MELAINQKKLGVILSYFNMLLSSIIGLAIVPFLIGRLGDVEYGVYQTVAALAGYFVIINFGIGSVITRYISMYLSKKDKQGESNFMAMSLIIASVLILILLVVGFIIFTQLNNIYSKTFTVEQIQRAKIIYILLISNLVVYVIIQAFQGVIYAYERFVVVNIFETFKPIIRVLILVLLILRGYNSIAIVAVDLGVSILQMLYNIIYVLFKLKIKIKLYKMDKIVLRSALIFSLAIFFQQVVNQTNNNVDSFLIGIMINPETVTLYSVAMRLFMIFAMISTVAVGIYLPSITKSIVGGANKEELTEILIKPNRFQALVSGTILFGFILVGKDFLYLWLGHEYLDAYTICLILMVPMFITYSNNMIENVLDALQKRMFRSIVLIIFTGLNVLMTIIFIKRFGYIGAPIATAITTFVGQIIFMNIYYHRVIRVNIVRLFKNVYKGILPSFLIAFIITYPINYLFDYGLKGFLIKGFVYVILFGVNLIIFGLNKEEKTQVKRVLNILKVKS